MKKKELITQIAGLTVIIVICFLLILQLSFTDNKIPMITNYKMGQISEEVYATKTDAIESYLELNKSENELSKESIEISKIEKLTEEEATDLGIVDVIENVESIYEITLNYVVYIDNYGIIEKEEVVENIYLLSTKSGYYFYLNNF